MDKANSTSRGRPRSLKTHQAILKAALDQAEKIGFRTVSVESIAAAAGVGKTTIYRRWPNKAAVVMDAFLIHIGPRVAFPERPRAIDSIQAQMHTQAKLFRGKTGELIRSLLGESQFDPELRKAFLEKWILPRRELTRIALASAVEQGDLRRDFNLDIVIDLLYSPFYYQLQIATCTMSDSYADELFEAATRGLRP